MKFKRRQRTRKEEDEILKFWGTPEREGVIILMVAGAVGLGIVAIDELGMIWVLESIGLLLLVMLMVVMLWLLITQAAAAIAILFFRWRERRRIESERIKAVFVFNQGDEEDV